MRTPPAAARMCPLPRLQPETIVSTRVLPPSVRADGYDPMGGVAGGAATGFVGGMLVGEMLDHGHYGGMGYGGMGMGGMGYGGDMGGGGDMGFGADQ